LRWIYFDQGEEAVVIKKRVSIILWVIVIIAVFATSYTIYSKNKTLTGAQPVPGTAEKQTAQNPGKTGRDTKKPEGTAGKAKVPDFTLKDVNGKSVKLSEYEGKTVFLNFWATWCPYCIEEMPELEEANKELLKGNEAVILTVDVMESADKVKKFISSQKLSLPVLMDTEGKTADAYGISGYPTTVVINPDGTLKEYMVGATDRETILSKVKKGPSF
jgi:peroxiredoxin